jgi:hypothetical protein
MTPATTRKYKEKGSHLGHGEIREEQNNTAPEHGKKTKEFM